VSNCIGALAETRTRLPTGAFDDDVKLNKRKANRMDTKDYLSTSSTYPFIVGYYKLSFGVDTNQVKAYRQR
jgi:hypothetical protein